ncbi:MAG: hypothetical protein FJX68_16665 [Alphaproteobacteria bacterium]|nr:hypothetical protein [Alphaproteobacteria bacterium]
MRWSVLALLGCLLLVSPSVLAGPQDIAAKRLFNEAVKLTDRAEAEGDGMRRRDLLRDAFARLERIVDEYPDSELAVKLISGDPIDRIDPVELRERLREAELAANVQQVTSNAAKAKAPVTAPAAVTLLTAPTDPTSIEGKILKAVVSSLERLLTGHVGAPKLKFSQPISAEREGGQVLLRFPGAKLVHGDGTAEFGNFLLSVVPRDGGRYGFALDLPSQIRVLDDKGKEAALLSYAEPRAKGLYWPELNAFEQLDLSLSGLKAVEVKAGQRKTVLEFVNFAIDQVLAEEPGQKLAGRSSANLLGFKLNPPDGPVVEMVRLGVTLRMSEFDLAGAKRFNAKLGLDLFGQPTAALSVEEQQRLATEQFKEMANFVELSGLGRQSGELAVVGVKWIEKGKPLFVLEDAALRFGLDTTKEPGSFSIGFEMGKLATSDKMPLPSGLTPSRFSVDLAIDRAPVRQFLVSALSALQTTEPGADPAELVNPEELMQMAMQAAPILRLDQLALTAPLLDVAMKGNATLDPQAANLMTGSLEGTIRGLDRAVKALNEQAKKDPEAKQALSLLVLLKGVGRPEVPPGGEAVYRYRIEMSPDGPTINGTPIDQLMQ